jgi:hypothetical protein
LERLETLYTVSLLFVEVHIFGTRRFNYFPLTYGGSKMAGEYEIPNAHLSSFLTNQKDLKLCTMLLTLPLVDVHIVGTEGSNSEYGGSKRGGGCEIDCGTSILMLMLSPPVM